MRRDWLLATTALLPIAAGPVMAQPAPTTGPTGGQVVAGQAGIATTPGRTTITQGTDRAAINWQQFNVGSQHTVQFVQPSQGSWTLNRVVGPDPSVIAGRVQANGGVAIVNQSGMVFAGGAQVNVGSLIASAAGITNENFMAGRMAFDQAARPGARVENRGSITVADRGLAALVGPGVSNSGVIRARLGRVALGAAETFVLDLAGDGLIGIDVTQAVRTAPAGGDALVTNSGVIEAAGGSVLITAHAASGLVEDLVRQTGRIEAPTLGTRTGEVAIRAEGGSLRVDGRVAATGGAGERGGRIALQATGTVTAGATARIDASGGAGGGQVLVGTTGRGRNQTMARQTIVERGAEIRADATGAGDGGMLVLNSLERTEMRGALSARGGATGGHGGFVELSGQTVIEAAGTVDVRAPAGSNGELLLDPQNIIVSNTALPAEPAGLPGGDSITVEITTATGSVTANTPENDEWTRVSTAAITGFAGTVTLDAARDIIVDSAIDKTNGGLSLLAGRNVTLGAAISVSGDFVASAGTGTIAVNAAVAAGTGQTITLRADTVSFGGAGTLAAPSGVVEIGPQTAGRNLRVGSNVANTLVLAAANLGAATITAGTLRLGETTITGLGTVTAGDVTVATGAGFSRPAGAGLEIIAGGNLTVDGGLIANAMRLAAGTGTLDIGANLRASALTLSAGTAIDQTAGNIQARAGAGTALPITAVAAGGAVSLDNGGNGNFVLGASSATAGFTVAADTIATTGAISGAAVSLTADTGALTIGADLRATGLTLAGATGIDQSGGTIQHRTDAATQLVLTANAAGGDISLAQDGNGTLALGASAASGTFTVAADTLATTGAVSGTTVTLTADTGALTIGADIRATDLALAGATGIDQTGGNIRHSSGATTQLTLTATAAGGDIDLARPGNGSLALGASTAGGTFTVAADTLRTTGAIAGTTVSLTADTGALTIDGDIRATSLALTGEAGITQSGGTIAHVTSGTELELTANAPNGAIVLDRAGNGVFALGASAADAGLTVAAETLRVTATVSGTDVSLTARAGALELEGDIRATGLTLAAATGISQAAGTTIRHAAGATTVLDLAASVSGTGDVVLTQGNGALNVLSGGATDGVFSVTSAEGLALAAGEVLSVAGAVTLTVQGADNALTLDGAIHAQSVALAAAGDITQGVDGVLAFRNATTGAADLATALALSVAVAGSNDGISLVGDNGRLRVTSATTTDGDIAIRGRHLEIAGAVTATGGGATLTAFNDAGTGTLAMGATAAITAQTLALNAARAITQDGAATITLDGGAGRLTVRGGAAGNSRAGSISLAGINDIGEIDIRATATPAGAFTGVIDVTVAGPVSVVQANGATVTLTAGELTVAAGQSGVVATGDVRLVADTLAIGAGVTAGTGGTLTLRTDTLGVGAGGSLSVAGGTLEVGPRTAGRAVAIDSTANPASLQIAAAALAGATADTIRIGSTTIAADTVTAGSVTVAEALSLGSGVAFEATATGTIAVNAALGAGSVRLDAGTAITLGAVDVTASGTGGGIALRAGTSITQAVGGALVAAGGTRDLVAHAAAGGITLAGEGSFRLADGGTPAGAAGPRSLYAAGSISLTTDGALTVATAAEAAAPGATLTLQGASVLIEAPLITPGDTGTVALTATGAGQTISQTAAGTITANLLTATADGAILLDQAPNAVASLGAIAFETAFGYRSASAVTVGTAIGPAGGGNADITLVADAGTLTLDAPISAGTGTVTLEATTGSIDQAATGAGITAGRLEVTAGINATLAPTGGNAVDVLGTSTVGGTLSLRTAGALALDGTISQSAPGGTLQVAAGGALTLNAGATLGFDAITLGTPGAMTLRGTVGVTGGAATSTVRLGAGGAITQEAGGIVAATLGVYSGGDVDLTAGANDVRAIAASATGTFALTTAGALSTGSLTGLPDGMGGTVDASGVIAGSVFLTADALTVLPSAVAPLGQGIWATAADGVVQLRADQITIGGRILAGDPGGSPTLNGTIDIAPRTTARAVQVGDGIVLDALGLSNAELQFLTARNLVIGLDAPGAGALTVTGPATVLNGVLDVTLNGGSIALDSVFTIPTPFEFPATGALLTLRATSGDIVQGVAGGVTADRLVAIADAGSVLMGSPGVLNSVGQVSGGVAAGEDFTFRNAGAFVVAAPGIAATGADVDLSAASGGITQTTGARIAADRLRVAAPGDVVLDGGASLVVGDLNAVGTLAPSSGANLTLRNAGALTVEGATATTGTITLEAAGLTLAGDITANQPGGHVVLRTGAAFDAPGAGSIDQTDGIIRAQGLSASAGGDVMLGGANEVQRLLAGLSLGGGAAANSVVTSPGGTFLMANSLADLQVGARVNAGTGGVIGILADGLSVAPGLFGTVFLAPGGVVQFAPFTAGGTIGLGGAGGFGDTTTISAAAIERVQTGRLIIGALEPTDQVSSGTITLRGAVDLTGAGAPQALELRSGGDIIADGFTLSVPQISAVASGSIRLGTAGSRIGSVVAGAWDGVSGIRAGGPVVSVTSAGIDAGTGLFTVAAPISLVGAGIGGTITLQAPDFALLPGATIDTGAGAPGRIEILSPGTLSLGGTVADAGTARLTSTELALLDANGGSILAAAPDIRLRGAWTIAPGTATRLELALTPGGIGAIRQIAGGLSVGTLTVSALQGEGVVQIGQAGNSLPVVGVEALGNINVATEGALEIRRTASSGGSVTFSGTDITLSTTGLTAGQVTIDNAGRAVNLTATAGDITGTAAQAAVRAGTLNATATAGEVRLTGDNAVGTLAAQARDGVAFRGTGATTVGAVGAGGAGTEVAGTIDIAAPSLTLNDVLGSGTVMLDATTGNLLQNAGARLSAATLAANAAGTLRLAGANGDGTARNTIQDLTQLTAGGDITLRNALALTLDLPISVGTDRVLTLEANGLTLANNLSAAGPNGQIILRTGSFNGGTASGGNITQTGGTISAAALAALAGGTVTLDRAGNAIGALGGGRDATGTALGLGLRAGTNATVHSDGFGGSAALRVTGALQVDAGGTLRLRADDLAIGAELRAPGGVITLLPITTGIGYVLGGASGNTTAGRITLDSTELGFLPSGTAAAELRLGALGVTGSIDIAGTVDLVNGAAPRVGRLTLAGDGALTQAAGTLLDVATLSALFPNGAVLLDPGTADNRIQALAGVTAGGNVEIRGGAGMMELRDGGAGSAISAPTGATIVLRADDLDIQAAILATAGTIYILPETLGRTVTLGGPNAAAGTLALGTAELALIRGAGDPPVSRLVIGADGVAGDTGTVRAAGDITVAGDVLLRGAGIDRVATLELVAGTPGTAGGSVRQTGGSVDVATITGTAQGDFQLGRAANAFDTATGITAGTLPATGATGRVDLATAGVLDAGTISAPVSVRVAAGGDLFAAGITAPVVTIEGGSVTLLGLVQGSTSVTIDSDGAVSQRPGALIVTGLFTLNGSSVSLPEDNQILELNGLVATGPVLALNTVLPVLVSGAVSAVGSLSLTTDLGLTVANTGSITVTGGPGSVSLAAGGAIDYAGILGASGAANLMAGGALGFSGTATIGTFAGFEARGAMTLGGTISAGGTMVATAGGALTLGGTITAGGDFTGTAGGDLGSTARLTATGDVTLSADAVLTAGGRIETLGGDLALTGATGLAANGTFIAGGSARLTATTGPLTLAGSLTAGVSLDLTGGGSVGTTAQVTTLGDANFTAAGALTAGGRIESTGGAVLMTATGALSSTGTLVADGNATLRSTAGALTLAGSLTAGGDATITGRTGLSATGSIDATGNALLSATAPAAALTLGGTLVAGGTATVTAGGAIGTTAQVTAAGDIGVTAGGTLTAGGRIESTGGALSMLGAALSVNATLVADGAATLRATSGTVGLAGILAAGGNAVVEAATGLAADGTFGAGGTLRFTTTAGPLTLAGTVAAGGTATVATGGALVTTAQVTAGGDATFTAGGTLAASGRIESTGGDLALTGATGLTSDAALVADGAATLRATGGTVGLTGSLTAGGNATVEAATGLAANGTFDAGGALRFATTTGGLVLGGTVTADGTASVTAGGAMTTTAQVTAAGDTTFTAGGTLAASGRIQSTGGDLALSGAGGLTSDATLLAGGAATLRASGGAIGLTGTVVANGAVAIEAAGALSSTGTVRAGTTLGLTAGGTITLAGTHVAGTALAATAGGGIGATGLVQAGTTATLTALGGDLVHGGAISAGGDVRLAAGAALANTGGISAGGALALAAGGALSQTGTVGAGGAAVLTAGGSVLLSGQTTAATDLDISAGGTATLTGGKITAGNAVRLTAGQGVTVQSFQIDPSTILLQTGGTMALTDSTLVSRDSIRLAAGAITLRRTNFNTGTLDVDSTGNLLLDGGQYTIGRAVAFSAPAGIQTTGRIFVSPRGTDLPAVIFDTRAGSTTPDPLTVVEPDIPGLPSRQQPTQVRVPGTEAPGDFGAASGAPAGTMVLNIDAGRSAIFLLLDGGTATGEIASAGRLAIHGTGGSAELTGRLTDVSGTPVDGAAAARFADSTRPAASGALTRYRLNGCVVSSVNCIVPSQIITIPQAPPQQVDLRLGNNRITDPEVQVPNVGDEDY
ncbi:filamentous hemagglutinin N-terminal domain-containing protein [Roseomonas sp. CECT 9278]|uniref:two-partner secretion domain-containing protein n=1 Tax=Roseomonas sp. CECT 9278 TaxID=2845823 RepID=UPI001E467B7A|nr:filamentous hemagglutinin N-terminal domain-containing protein [Roseomonas sp. CECT 9278]